MLTRSQQSHLREIKPKFSISTSIKRAATAAAAAAVTARKQEQATGSKGSRGFGHPPGRACVRGARLNQPTKPTSQLIKTTRSIKLTNQSKPSSQSTQSIGKPTRRLDLTLLLLRSEGEKGIIAILRGGRKGIPLPSPPLLRFDSESSSGLEVLPRWLAGRRSSEKREHGEKTRGTTVCLCACVCGCVYVCKRGTEGDERREDARGTCLLERAWCMAWYGTASA